MNLDQLNARAHFTRSVGWAGRRRRLPSSGGGGKLVQQLAECVSQGLLFLFLTMFFLATCHGQPLGSTCGEGVVGKLKENSKPQLMFMMFNNNGTNVVTLETIGNECSLVIWCRAAAGSFHSSDFVSVASANSGRNLHNGSPTAVEMSCSNQRRVEQGRKP